MPTLLFANNAQTTLAGPIASGALSVNLAAGTGSEFPSPTTGQYFVMTFTDAATGLIHEIVFVTARSGDTLTVVRAQEGTTARSWLAGDIAGNWWTAGSAATMVQVQTLQVQPGNYAVDTGSVNNIQISLNPAPATLATIAGAPIRVLVAQTNTAATTLTIAGLASTAVFAQSGTAPLLAGSITIGQIYEFTYVPSLGFEVATAKVLLSTTNKWTAQQFLTNNMYWGGQNSSGVTQSLIGVDSSNQTTVIAGPSGSSAFRILNNAFSAALAYIGSAGGLHAVGGIVADTGDITASNGRLRAAQGALGSGDSNAATLLGDFPSSTTGSGFLELPNGLIIQWGFETVTSWSGIAGGNILFPRTFPNACLSLVICESGALSWVTGNATLYSYTNFNASGFALVGLYWDGTNWVGPPVGTFGQRWQAIGY